MKLIKFDLVKTALIIFRNRSQEIVTRGKQDIMIFIYVAVTQL